jgi:hypothetical protein
MSDEYETREIKLNRDDFKFFEEKVRHWIDVFGLHSWKLYFNFENIEGDFAEISTNSEGRAVTFTLGSVWSSWGLTSWPSEDEEEALTEKIEEQINLSALHEVVHLLLIPVHIAAKSRFDTTELHLDTELHSVIRTLENLHIRGFLIGRK